MDSNEQDFVRRALMMILLFQYFCTQSDGGGGKMRWEDGDFFFFSSFQHRRCVWMSRLFEIFVFILYHFASRSKYTRGTREYLMTHRLKYNCEYRGSDADRYWNYRRNRRISFERKFCARIFRNDGNLNEFSFFLQKEYFNIRQSFLGRQIDPSHFGKMGFSIVLSKFE